MSSSQFIFRGGIKIPGWKKTADKKTEIITSPEKVYIPMLHHIGAPCIPVVKKGDRVKIGQVIGDTDKFVSAPVHSSVSGTVENVSPMLHATGNFIDTIEIKNDGLGEVHKSVKPPEYSSLEEFMKAVRASGLVGLGGAGFPAHVKLTPPKDKKIDLLIINAAECEPYITSDYREIMENSWNVISGINILMELLPFAKVIIGVEDNKPHAILELVNMAKTNDRIDVQKMESLYPQGAEKMLIYSITGRKVPPGKLPSDVGCVVMNVSSIAFIAEYVKTGMPLVKRRITVDGPAVAESKNVEVPVGTVINDVFNFCGGFKKNPEKIIMGGPMMGVAQHSLHNPVLKQTNALLAFDDTLTEFGAESVCIRCGKCVNACPMSLMPLSINAAALHDQREELLDLSVNDCIECGCCSYVCPAKRHLVQSIRLGKAKVR